jgi:hypothetical protein
MTNSAIYGYKKSPDDKNLWLVDEEAAVIVRRIFQMTIDGKGPDRIRLPERLRTKSTYAPRRISQSATVTKFRYPMISIIGAVNR